MNSKQLAIILGLLVVLGGAGLLVQHSRNNSLGSAEKKLGGRLLGKDFQIDDVAAIDIKQGTNELILSHKDTDIWRVRQRNDYPANYSQIREFLLKMPELKIVQTEQVGPSQLPRLQLAAGQGTALEFKDKSEKTLKSITLGKLITSKSPRASQFGDEGTPNGRYVMLPGDTQNVLLIADPLNNVEPKADAWLDKDFFKVERPKSISVSFPDATNSWKISRDVEAGDWKLADLKPEEQLDTNKIAGVTSPFSSPTFNDVLSKSARPEDNGLDKPTVVTVETLDDFTYTVKLGKKSGDDYPLTLAVTGNFSADRPHGKDEKPDEKEKADKAWSDRRKQLEDKLKQARTFENWTYLVSSWGVDPVLKERKDLLVEKKEEKPADKADAPADKKEDAKPADPIGMPPVIK